MRLDSAAPTRDDCPATGTEPLRCVPGDDLAWCIYFQGPPMRILDRLPRLVLLAATVAAPMDGLPAGRADVRAQDRGAAVDDPRGDFEIGSFETVPSDASVLRDYVKPGHAVTVWVPAVSRRDDFRGEWEAAAVDAANRPIPLRGTQYHLVLARPAVLSKGQTKYVESTYLIPTELAGEGDDTLFLRHVLKSARDGRIVFQDAQPTRQLPAHQYLFVVLAANPNAYGYLQRLPAIRPAYDDLFDEDPELVYYRVLLPAITQQVPLPTHSLAWTPFAYLLWDGLMPQLWTAEQQQALLDWLHWGGQLIISGPQSLGLLAGGFLDAYLPADAGGPVALTTEHFEPLCRFWTPSTAPDGPRRAVQLPPANSLAGIRLVPRSGGEFLEGTGELVCERRVGRGRIVVTGFALTGADVVNWESFDSFFNGALLRRPPRTFRTNRFGVPQTQWEGYASRRLDPRFVTATRYFARDVGSPAARTADLSADAADWWLDGTLASPVGGVGSWNDQSGTADVARWVLRDAAGISIPTADFVWKVLAAYLILLVPVNWAVFRAIGRVEWAWLAAPVLALGGAAAVIRLAQLDIGFVRSHTEVAVLELHEGYARGHLTRYLALYASLSTPYELEFDDPAALVQPFAPTRSPDRLTPLTLRRDRQIRATGFRVESNTTGFLHGEHFVDVAGPVRLTGAEPQQWRVENGSNLTLTHAALVYRTLDGDLLSCWLGDVPAGGRVAVDPRLTSPGTTGVVQRSASGGDGEQPEVGAIDLTALVDLAVDGLQVLPGDVRLIARAAEPVAGMRVVPRVTQVTCETLVVVHLRRGLLPPPRPDSNHLREIASEPANITDADRVVPARSSVREGRPSP